MAIASTSSLVNALRQYQLLEPAQLAEVNPELVALPSDPRALAKQLIDRGWLTPYQANQLLGGLGGELVLGPYVLLERLGEGGMGQVFKARHRHLKRVVAVKVIRPECLAKPTAVRRFQREVRAAAQLDHPNIVHAYDADQIGDKHILVMENVEGTDLARRVAERGPLPVLVACDYVRQAALGLQHAHDRGLIHRDIKPHNLLLTSKPGSPATGFGAVVKILDMGLARLTNPLGEDGSSSTLTQSGVVMGTPDYIAPEQAWESHHVDIRADLYSLGCTLYFLLTGRPPFPGGTVGEKLLHHHKDEPIPVEQLRPEAPPGVAGIVRKLMAKLPGDRYQTPRELAMVLEEGLRTGHWPGPFRPSIAAGDGIPVATPVRHPSSANVPLAVPVHSGPSPAGHQPGWSVVVNAPTSEGIAAARDVRRAAERRRFKLLATLGGVVLFAGIVLLAIVVIRQLQTGVTTRARPSEPSGSAVPPTKPAPLPVGGVVEPGNVALASNKATVSGKGTQGHLLIDGITTGYSGNSGFATDNWPCEWLITLPKTYRLVEIRLLFFDLEANRYYQYAVETSADGRTFEPLADRSSGKWRSWQTLSFPARPVQALKIKGLFNSANQAFHLVEVEAYCTPPTQAAVPKFPAEP